MGDIFAGRPDSNKPWDVVIIGSGPSALTAAIYSTRGAASTLILGGEKWGGQLMLTTTVDNWPAFPGIQGPDLMAKMREHSVMYGAEFLEKYVESVNLKSSPFEVKADKSLYKTKSIIIATGAETVWLNVPGEKELIGRGVSSCAPCDAPFFKEKRVAVVGGGDSAMEEALVLSKYALEVTLIHRRDAFRASAAMQKKVLANSKIKVLWNSEVTKLTGTNKLEKVSVKNNKTGTEEEFSFDGIFVAIGHTPSTALFKDQIELDEKGYIAIQQKEGFSTATSVNGVFVAGDVHDHFYKQAIVAAGFGCMAAMDMLKYLDNLS